MQRLLCWIKISSQLQWDRKVESSDKCMKCRKIIIGKCKRSSTPYLVWGIIYYERNLAIYDIIQVNIFLAFSKAILSASTLVHICAYFCSCVNEIHPKFIDSISMVFCWHCGFDWFCIQMAGHFASIHSETNIQAIRCSTVLLILMPFHSLFDNQCSCDQLVE